MNDYRLCLLVAGLVAATASAVVAAEGELDAWKAAKAADRCDAWQDFLNAYPASKLATLARSRLAACPPTPVPQTIPQTIPQTVSPTPSQPPPSESIDDEPSSLLPAPRDIMPTADAVRTCAPEQIAPTPPAEPKPSAKPPTQSETFIIQQTSDGFVAVRARPNTGATEVGRLYAGQRLVCAGVVRGQDLRYGDRWVHCPTAAGYIYATLLTPDLSGQGVRRFVVRATSDGFVAVRSAPSISSGHRIAKLRADQTVYCDRLLEGQRLRAGNLWLHCPSVDGFIHAPLLIPD